MMSTDPHSPTGTRPASAYTVHVCGVRPRVLSLDDLFLGLDRRSLRSRVTKQDAFISSPPVPQNPVNPPSNVHQVMKTRRD